MWVYIAISGYSLLAVESVISKYLLAGRMKSWQIYAFYVGLFSAFSFIFAPFGLHWYGTFPFVISVLSGLIFYLSLVFLYQALLSSSTSRVYILYGAVTTIITAILSKTFLKEYFTFREIGGIAFLIMGGFFISYKFYASRFFSNYKETVLAGLLLGISFVLLKYGYNEQRFIMGYVTSRVGIVAGALASLLFPNFRKAVRTNLKRRKRKENIKNVAGTAVAKTISGIGSILLNYSISLGSVALVSALVSVQYLLTFVFSLVLSLFLARIFVEKFSLLNILAKTAGILAVALGTMLVIFK